MIEGDRIERIEVNSTWEAELGEGCELSVHLGSGKHLFVIRPGLESAQDEIERWRTEHVGTEIDRTREITSVALATGGQQTTLDITLEGGFNFEGDLIEEAERTEKGTDDLETEWTFEGTPGVEMGQQEPDDERA